MKKVSPHHQIKHKYITILQLRMAADGIAKPWFYAQLATYRGIKMTAHKKNPELMSLKFALEVEEDWPPFAVESLPFTIGLAERYRLTKPPLFVKDLSVDDVIAVKKFDSDGNVVSWRHVARSKRTTIWILRLKQNNNIDQVLDELRKLGCNTVGLDQAGCYSIDVPEALEMEEIDAVLSSLEAERAAIAYPSMRHPE